MRMSDLTHRLAEAQNWRCCYCGFVMLAPRAGRHEVGAILQGYSGKGRFRARSYRLASREHIVPRCDGGSDALENLLAACRWCNEYRGNRPIDEAFARIRRLVARGTHPHQIWHATRRFPQMSRLRTVLPMAEAVA